MKIISEQVLLPKDGEKINKIVIMLHGYGSSGSDLIELAPYLLSKNPNVAFFSPDAPHKMGHLTGYEWFSLASREEDFMLQGACNVMDSVVDYIDQKIQQYKVDYSDVYLLGFSQGAMLSMHVAYHMKNKIAGVIGFSGKIIKPSALGKTLKNKVPTLLIHGKYDDIVPYFLMEQAHNILSKLSVEVKSVTEENLAHSIGNKGIKAASEFINTKNL
jgi:phospholipase/carboxylesterase